MVGEGAAWAWVRRAVGAVPAGDLRGLDVRALRAELAPALAVGLLSVPQGLAYAVIAGLPPAMGLYAGAIPALVGSLVRSSRVVVVGPSNAVSLLVATSVIPTLDDPAAGAATLALLVGAMQLAAGVLRLEALVDYISKSVVVGYITGAAALIAVGQLPSLTGTTAAGGDIVARVAVWLGTLPGADLASILVAVGAIGGVLLLRRWLPRGIPALSVLALATAGTWASGLDVATVGDLATIPARLPPFGLPTVADAWSLVPVAVAAMVLSLVESSSLSRSYADRTGQKLQVSWDFAGMGAANLAASVFGGYPVSGSLSRTALSYSLGARTRLAGVLAGVVVALSGLLGPALDHAPIPALAAVILVIAVDLIDPVAIRGVIRSGPADRFAFLGTVIGTWVLPLDEAIYLGVAISVVLFLRRVRLLVVRELWIDTRMRLYEVEADRPAPPGVRCRAVRVLHVEGPLFFGSASELEDVLHERIEDPEVQVLVLRLKRAQGLDYTVGDVLRRANAALARDGRHLMLVGLREDMMQRLADLGVADALSQQVLYPTVPGWFSAMNQALADALVLVDRSRCGHADGADCPLVRYAERWELRPQGGAVAPAGPLGPTAGA